MNREEYFQKLRKMLNSKSNGNKDVPDSQKPRQFSTPTI